MSNYNFNTLVSKQEQEALKEMIFKRVNERAQALNNDTNTKYTNNIKNDVMELARDSFVASKNPFSAIQENVKHEDTSEQKIKESRQKIETLKKKIYEHHEQQKSRIVNTFLENNMQEARVGLENKQAFTGALSFLNSKASLEILSKKNTKFETIA